MANFEDLQLVFQTHTNFENLRRDMRANANAYVNAVPNFTIPQIRTRIAADAAQYQIRLGWQLALWNDLTRRAKLVTGLTALSLTQTELQNIYTELKAAADFQQAATINNATDVTNLKNSLLGMITVHDSVFNGG